jgi:hypothetical protein
MPTRTTRRLAAATMAAAALLAIAGFTALGSVFEYPQILKEPTADILALYRAHQGAVMAWFAVLMVSAALLAPAGVLLGRLAGGSRGRWIAGVGVVAAAVQVIGLSRWVLLVPSISHDATDPARTAGAHHSFQLVHTWLGTILGETIGYALTAAFTVLITLAVTRSTAPRWMTWLGYAAAALIATGVVIPLGLELASLTNFAGYVLWCLWLLAMAAFLWRAPAATVSPTAAVTNLARARFPATPRTATGDGEQVGAGPEQARLGLDAADGPEDPFPARRVGQPPLDVGQHPGRALHGQQGVQAQAGLGDLPGQLLGQVEEGGGEPLRASGRVAVLAVAQVALDDRLEPRLVQVAAEQAVAGGREPGDPGRGQDPARAQHPPRLGEGPDPVAAVGQVVQGAQQQDGVDAGVGPLEPAGVTHAGAGQRAPRLLPGGAQRLLDVDGHRVDQVDLVAPRGQGQGVHASGPADVQDDRGCRRQVPDQQLPGADPLKAQGPEPPLLRHLGVVGGDLAVEPLVIGHRAGTAIRRPWPSIAGRAAAPPACRA